MLVLKFIITVVASNMEQELNQTLKDGLNIKKSMEIINTRKNNYYYLREQTSLQTIYESKLNSYYEQNISN